MRNVFSVRPVCATRDISLAEATEFTFYSGTSNIDFELQDGNPAAIAIRFHVAQHSELTHMNPVWKPAIR